MVDYFDSEVNDVIVCLFKSDLPEASRQDKL
jgi:hypothetical protein